MEETSNLVYVSFYVDGHLLGIEVNSVQEVLTMQTITSIPLAYKSVAGLLNLRGQVVTAIDLRKRLGLEDFEKDQDPMNVVIRNSDELFSLIVDQVGDVLTLNKDSFDHTPSNVDSLWKEFCKGVHPVNDELLIVIDVSSLVEVRKKAS